MSDGLRLDIAKAIRKADGSYFFEDYGKQADAVMAVLKQHGATILPAEPSKEMIEAGLAELVGGRIKPETLVVNIWNAMLKQARKEHPLTDKPGA